MCNWLSVGNDMEWVVCRFAQDDNAMCLCVALVPVDTGNTGGDSTLSLPQIRFFVMPGENNTTSWVMVSEFSAEGILRTLPVRPPAALSTPQLLIMTRDEVVWVPYKRVRMWRTFAEVV
jgi:hypothetical protein